ncbi:hypothetical protein ACFY36_20745 [Actinoplanes sp. NPDC000266]
MQITEGAGSDDLAHGQFSRGLPERHVVVRHEPGILGEARDWRLLDRRELGRRLLLRGDLKAFDA